MKKKILIVDDEQTLLTALADIFTQSGFEVLSETCGTSGLASALKHHPDMILLDLIMPEMDGMTMLSELRKDRWGKDVKVMLLTNLSDTGNISKSISSNVIGYLVKSDWKLQDVVREVSKKLDT